MIITNKDLKSAGLYIYAKIEGTLNIKIYEKQFIEYISGQ